MAPAWLAAALLCSAPAWPSAADLHVHLRMDAALPGIFHGEPGEAPTGVADPRAVFRNQVSLPDLRAADVRLIVASLYAPVVISQLQGGYLSALLRQADAVEDWVKRHPEAVLVRTPDEAEAALKSKAYRLAVVLGVEGGHGVDSVERLEELRRRGVRLITITHFSDSPWAGSAAVRYGPLSDCRPGGPPNEKRNPVGLTELGKTLLEAAVETGVLVDLTHASDKTVADVAARHPDLPLLFTHQGARDLTPCERMLSVAELRAVKKSRGMVGITFASNYLGPGLPDLILHASAMAREAGPEAIALGSDFNGFIPRIEGAADTAGYALILRGLAGARIPARRSAEAFVGLWRRSLGIIPR